MRAAAVLTVLRDGETLKKITIDGEADLGRAEGCVIRLDDRAISRQHAVFRPTGDGLAVEKRSEFGPLVVNGSECTRAILKEGDVISLGPYLMKLSMQALEREGREPPGGAYAGAQAAPAFALPAAAPVEQPATAPVPLVAGDTVQLDASEIIAEGADGAPGLELDASGMPALAPPIGTDAALGSPLEAAPAGGDPAGGEIQMPDLGALPAIGGVEVAAPNIDLSGSLGAPAGGPGEAVLDMGASGSQPAFGSPAEAVPDLGPPIGGAEFGTSSISSGTTGPVDPEGLTKISSGDDIKVKLVFKPGTAPIAEFEINKEEISIGRGKDCDIVLDDKKVSRKNSTITRQGPRYIIKDLDSANGTYVNGRQVKEEQLYADDNVRIGNSEFQVIALSQNYAKREKDFIALPPMAMAMATGTAAGSEPSVPPSLDVPEIQVPDIGLPPPVGAGGEAPFGAVPAYSGPAEVMTPAFGQPMGGPIGQPLPIGQGLPSPYGPPPGLGGVNGMPGIGGDPLAGINGAKPPKGLIARFKASTGPKRYMYIALFIALAYFLFLDEDEGDVVIVKGKGKPKQTQTTKDPNAKPTEATPQGPLTFEQLSPDKKRYVEAQHNLAFDLYRNRDYEHALFEIRKIFDIIPDYKDSREIERYAKEAKAKIDAAEEEKKKKEEEARTKAKIADLTDQAQKLMDQKQYDQAKEVFIKIIELDPENQQVAKWRKEIEEANEKQRFAKEASEVQKRISQKGWEIYGRGIALKKKGRYHAAIAVFSEAIANGSHDGKVEASSRAMIKACKELIASTRDPLLKQGQEAEAAGNFAQAFTFFRKANGVDPGNAAALAGMARVKKVLHDRAKVIYTEAVLAESYSDFETARRKYEECRQVSPPDDIYHQRAQRKLGHYFRKEASE